MEYFTLSVVHVYGLHACLVFVFHFRASEDTFNYNEVVH